MDLLNLNKTIEDKKKKEHEKTVIEITERMGKILWEKKYKLFSFVEYAPHGVIPRVTFVPLKEEEIEKIAKEMKKNEDKAKATKSGNKTPNK